MSDGHDNSNAGDAVANPGGYEGGDRNNEGDNASKAHQPVNVVPNKAITTFANLFGC